MTSPSPVVWYVSSMRERQVVLHRHGHADMSTARRPRWRHFRHSRESVIIRRNGSLTIRLPCATLAINGISS